MSLNPLDADTWLFDLDNTLYSHQYNLFHSVAERMTQFIMQRFSLPRDEAKKLQSKYYHETGTTLRGLMIHHDVPAREFLEYVHDIDYSRLPPNPKLDALLSQLPVRKIIFTNGSTAHAQSVINQLGVADHFREFFDIIYAEFIPKPHLEPYQKLIEKFDIEPSKTLMIEDLAANLKPAKELKMQTVFIATDEEWAKPRESDWPYIDHKTHDLTDWLERILSY